MRSTLGEQLLAAGRKPLPLRLEGGGCTYHRKRIFKHDFFAATALYQAPSSDQIVLKLSRRGDLLGIPLAWLGRCLCRHEEGILRHLRAVSAVPELVGRWDDTGLLYHFAPGQSLDERPSLPDDFFDNLEKLLDEVHAHRVAYVDMNKRGNILLTTDGLPHLIDFQISLHIPARLFGSARLAETVWRRLVAEDRYHLRKHKRRLRPDLMSADEVAQSRRVSGLIGLHRWMTRPLTRCRRRLLGWLARRDMLSAEDEPQQRSPENDPRRWTKDKS